MNEVTAKAPNPLIAFNNQLENRTDQFAAALPKHIPAARFKRVVMTAVQMNPALLGADQRSFWNAAMKCAADGLLPDSREAALVIYKVKAKDGNREIWIDAVTYMPMIAGIRKKVRNSTEITTWEVHCVYAKDQFAYGLGDEPYIRHEPYTGEDDPGQIVAAYSVAKLKGGDISREVMTRREIEKVRLISKAKDGGPWSQWYGEMARKTVARRHSKVLPMSTDLDDLIRRDDALYDFEGKKDHALPPAAMPGAARPRLQDFTETVSSSSVEADDGAGEQNKAETIAATVGSPAPQTQESAPTPPHSADGKAGAARETTAPAEPAPHPILAEARENARKGKHVFNLWWNTTNRSQKDAINTITEELLGLADDADKAMAAKHEGSPRAGDGRGGSEVRKKAADEQMPTDPPGPTTADAQVSRVRSAHELGRQARDKNYLLKAVPSEFRDPGMEQHAAAWQAGWTERDKELSK